MKSKRAYEEYSMK